MKKSWVLTPEAQITLERLGADLRAARIKRRIKTSILAQRAGIAENTLAAIEKGSPNTAMGNYVKVIFSLGLLNNLEGVFDEGHDLVGQMLEEERLPKRVRN
jgi:DNA-binding XRE family transcriptional regulator